MTTDIKPTPSSVAAFKEALWGDSGSLDAWLEANDESEVAAHIEAYASGCVSSAIAEKDAEIDRLRTRLEDTVRDSTNKIERLQAEVEEWKDAARCASEQQDSLFREARELNERADKLRSEVESVNSWNARVSVCRDHVADIVDGPCVICVLDALEAYADRMWAEADRLAKEVIRIQQQYDERTACVIVHRGSALACSDAVRSAYLDEHHRAERLAEVLRRILDNEAPDWKFAEEFGGYVLDDELREEALAALEQDKGGGYWPEMPKNGGPDWTGFDG